MYQKKEKNLQKLSPHLSQLNVAMTHRNYFRRNNLQVLNWQQYTKIADHYSRCKLATFLIGKDCQMFIFYFVNTKHQVLLICNENRFLLPIWWYNRGLFPLGIGNKYFGVFVLNGLMSIALYTFSWSKSFIKHMMCNYFHIWSIHTKEWCTLTFFSPSFSTAWIICTILTNVTRQWGLFLN